MVALRMMIKIITKIAMSRKSFNIIENRDGNIKLIQ
jgi:hypothetical protein